MFARSVLIKSIFITLLFLIHLPVLAHGDDDHGAAAPIMNQVVAPRAIATSEDFELVAILNRAQAQTQLIIYLDQFTTNAPVLNAKIEVEGAGLKQVAKEMSPGVYSITLPSKFPDKFPLTFSIETEDNADLLNAILDTTPVADEHDHEHEESKSKWLFILMALIVLCVAAWFVKRRFSSSSSNKNKLALLENK
jgi:hypothetical protein